MTARPRNRIPTRSPWYTVTARRWCAIAVLLIAASAVVSVVSQLQWVLP